MNYATEGQTERAKESALWPELEKQNGAALPYLLERYLLLENWRYLSSHNTADFAPDRDDVNFLHQLLADAVTVLLGQEERLRALEAQLAALSK